MNINMLDKLSRLSARAAVCAITVGAALLAGNSFAESTIKPRVNNSEQETFGKNTGASRPAQTPGLVGVQNAEPMQRYIISLSSAPVARYRGGVAGFAATSPEGQSKLNIRSQAVSAYRGYLANTQEELLDGMARALGRDVQPIRQLQIANNAIVVALTADEAQRITQLKGVSRIQQDQLLQLTSNAAYDGYARSHSQDSALLTIAMALLLLVFLLMIAVCWRYWRSREVAMLAAILAALGLVGCNFEGGFVWIGAPEVWDGEDGLKPVRGEGIVVGIIDTGINPISNSFAAVDGDGYQHTNPKGKYFGVCDTKSKVYDKSFPCNDKLIGAWSFLEGEATPRDFSGHGSHTAGTAAGNVVYGATIVAPSGFELTKDIAGVAPRANIIAYKVCGEKGCFLSAILAGIDQAIADGVDVINYSIGGKAGNPWVVEDPLAFLAAMEAGIFVATSAGNSGPKAATLGNPGDAPWITTVGASSHNFVYASSLAELTNDQGNVLADIFGEAVTPGFGPAAIVDAADYGNPQCLPDDKMKFTKKFSGQIVICDGGGKVARVNKGRNVKANGGSAMILSRTNTTPDGSGYLEADAHVIPTVQITYTDVTALREWLANGSGHQGRITATQTRIMPELADVMAFFSSRGENSVLPDIVKPNVTAPGRAVFAAYTEGYSSAEQDYNLLQGTSMSSPHVAGAGALLSALHPTWSPMQIQSALMTTAKTEHRKEDGTTQADPFDMGAGRIDLPSAARAALLFDEDAADFKAANPNNGGDPRTLNLASLGDGACVVKCSWKRTVTNASDMFTMWTAVNSGKKVTVEPESFFLEAGKSTELTFTADVSAITYGDWYFDQVGLMSLSGLPNAHLPVAIKSAIADLPKGVVINAVKESDTVALEGLKAIEITDGTATVTGLVKGQVLTGAVVSDPTNSNPFDGGFDPNTDGQQFFVVDVAQGSTRLVAQITQSASGDLDLYLGTGDTPSADTMLLESITPDSSFEYVELLAPDAGKYWLLVDNWEQGHSDPQAYTMNVGLVAKNDLGNMTVTMPKTQPVSQPFAIDIKFDLPGSAAKEIYYGSVSLGSDAANPGNLGTIQVDLVRE